MIRIRHTLLGLCIATLSLGALAQHSYEYKDHHPTSSPAVAVKKTEINTISTENMNQQIKAMQAMHEQMMSVKNPAERQKLMAEHMKLMQEGMTMMNHMGNYMGNNMGNHMGNHMGNQNMNYNMVDRQTMIENRMDMMQYMMQMMMDRLPASSTK